MHISQVLSASALIAAGVALTPKYDVAKYDTERKSAGSLVVGVALVTVAVELIFIILRFLNVGLLNYKIKWFLIVVSFHEGGGGGGGSPIYDFISLTCIITLGYLWDTSMELNIAFLIRKIVTIDSRVDIVTQTALASETLGQPVLLRF